MDRLKNNKGLSLVELIVALAIFAIAGIAIYGFVSFSTKNFTESNKNVKLQYEQQIVVNRIKDIVLETSRGISYSEADHKLLVLSDNPDYVKDPTEPRSLIYQIRWDEETKLIKVSSPLETDATSLSDISFAKEYELGNNVSDFNVDLSELDEGRVTLSMTFKTGEKEVTVNPVITLRNYVTKVDNETDLDELYSEIVIPIYSHVARVEISRDGKVFAQNKVDTIAMAGTSTSAVYTATVFPKSGYELKDDTVDWDIDLGTDTPKDGWESHIIITESGNDCKVTVVESDGAKPSDYLPKGYLTLVATSNEDTTKSGRIRIKISSDGVYPESITSQGYDKYTADAEHGQIRYKISHTIKYTGNIEDPLNPGVFSTELSGDSAYTKITYKVTEVIYNGSDSSKALTSVPGGAGFTATDTVDGVFIATKSMEEHTFKVRVTVNQRGKDGQEVYDEFEIKIGKDIIPEPQDVTKPVIRCDDRALRAGIFDMSAEWSAGAPEFVNKNGENQRYYYWFEWEIDNINNDCGNWGSDVKNNFGDLMYFTKLDSNPQNGSDPAAAEFPQTYGSDNGRKVFTAVTQDSNGVVHQSASRAARVYVKPSLDWEKPFTFRVTLRVKLSETDNAWDAKYYMLPGTDPEHPDSILADNSDQIFTASKVVTIKPVSLKLVPATITDSSGQTEYVVFYTNKKPWYAVFNNSHTIGLGRSNKLPADHENYYECTRDYDAYARGYYKIFEPEFEGIRITTFNVNAIGKMLVKLKNGKSSLQTYRTADGRVIYSEEIGGSMTRYGYIENDWQSSYNQGINTGIVKVVDGKEVYTSRLYFYLQIKSFKWNDTNQFPDGCVWTCQFAQTYDDSGTEKIRNYVTGTFSDTGQNESNYTIKKDYGEFLNQ